MKPKMIPVGEAKRIADLAVNRAFKLAVTVMISAVADDGLYSAEDIQRLWHSINYKADSIRRGYASVEDFQDTLREEYGINTAGEDSK